MQDAGGKGKGQEDTAAGKKGRDEARALTGARLALGVTIALALSAASPRSASAAAPTARRASRRPTSRASRRCSRGTSTPKAWRPPTASNTRTRRPCRRRRAGHDRRPSRLGSAVTAARAAIAGLTPDTTYHYRLVATNSSGPPRPPSHLRHHPRLRLPAGRRRLRGPRDRRRRRHRRRAAGSHPYQLSSTSASTRAANSRASRASSPGRRPARPRHRAAAGVILNPSAQQLHLSPTSSPRAPRPSKRAARGRAARTRARSARSRSQSACGGGKVRRFGLFNLDPPPGVAAQLGFCSLRRRRSSRPRYPKRRRRRLLVDPRSARTSPSPRHQRPRRTALGHPLGRLPRRRTGQLPERGGARLPLGQMLGRGALEADRHPARLPDPADQLLGPLAFAATASSWQQPGPGLGRGDSTATPPRQPAPTMSDCASLAFDPNRLGPPHRHEGLLAVRLQLPPQRQRHQLTDPDQVARAADQEGGRHACRPGSRQPLGRRRPGRLHPGPVRRRDRAFDARAPAAPTARRSATSRSARRSSTSCFEGAIYLASPTTRRPPTRAPRTPSTRWSPSTWSPSSPERGVQVKLAGQIDPDPRPATSPPPSTACPSSPTPTSTSTSAPASAPSWSPRRPAAPATTHDRDDLPGPKPARVALRPTAPQIKTGVGGGPCPRRRRRPSPRTRGRRGQLQRQLLHPLLRPPHPQRHRTGDHLLLAGPAQGHHRQAGRRPLLPRGGDRSRARQARRRGDGRPLLPGGQPGRPHPDRLRRRSAPSPTRPGASTSPAPTTAPRSRW